MHSPNKILSRVPQALQSWSCSRALPSRHCALLLRAEPGSISSSSQSTAASPSLTKQVRCLLIPQPKAGLMLSVPLQFTGGRAAGWTLFVPAHDAAMGGTHSRRGHRTEILLYSSHAHCQPSPELLPAPSYTKSDFRYQTRPMVQWSISLSSIFRSPKHFQTAWQEKPFP